ncbi:MAG: hypothetical protein Q9166_003921 [cf. Caloplaca sp. 2 TL-2023]
MAYSPASTASSSDLYAPSGPSEEQGSGQPIDHELPRDQRATSLHRTPAPSTQSSPKPGTIRYGRTQSGNDGSEGGCSGRQADTHSKRKREEDSDTSYAIIAEAGNPEPHSRDGHGAGYSPTNLPDDARKPSGTYSGPKRIRVNGLPPTETSPAVSRPRPANLPAELWHHVFRFVPPVFLGRLLRVNHAFHSYLTSGASESQSLGSSFPSAVCPLDADSIWAASRKRFAPGLPKPLRDLKELDMWRLLRGKACQICGQVKDPGAVSADVNPWESGPGDRIPASMEMVKRYYKLHVQRIRQELDDVRELGSASADEWSKGLAEEGKQRINDAIRWEQWEAKGGLKRVNTRPQIKVTAPSTVTSITSTLPQKPQISVPLEALKPQQVPMDPHYYAQPLNGFVLPAESYQYPHGAARKLFTFPFKVSADQILSKLLIKLHG